MCLERHLFKTINNAFFFLVDSDLLPVVFVDMNNILNTLCYMGAEIVCCIASDPHEMCLAHVHC